MIRTHALTLALGLAGTLALAACNNDGVQTADNSVDTPATTAAADPALSDDTAGMQDHPMDRSDRDVSTMGDVNDPYATEPPVRDGTLDDGQMENDPLEEAGEEIEQEVNEAERELEQ